MPAIKPKALRTPPAQAKLARALETLKELAQVAEHGDAEMALGMAARDEIQKMYRSGLPSGIDPALVRAAVAEVMPLSYELAKMTKKAGTEYDAAIAHGIREHVGSIGLAWVLEPALVAVLSEHAGVSIADANQMLLRAERAVDRDPSTNLPADRSPAVLERVRAAMAPWFEPAVMSATLAIARDGLPPTRWGSGEGATAPQCDEEWALFIACALHPSEEARAIIASRAALIPLLDEAGRAAVNDVLAAAES